MGRQRQQAGLLFGPDVGDTAVGVVGMTSAVGDIVSPAAELGVDVVEVAECGFRGKPITDSGRNRSLIPIQTDHRFRSKPITFSRG